MRDRVDARTIRAVTDPAPTTLVLVRHGESNVTVRRVIGGHRTCDGLSDLGRQQAERLRDRLSLTHELASAVLVSSSFRRAIETAETIAPSFADPSIEIDAGFGEHDPGPAIDGMSFVEYVERYGQPDWSGDPHVEIFPGGETSAQFHLRVGETISRTVATHAGKTVVVACHGGVVDAAFRYLLRTAPTGLFELQTRNTSITEFQHTPSGAWRLARYNDAAHLHDLPVETPRA